jgi:hypothetical protein
MPWGFAELIKKKIIRNHLAVFLSREVVSIHQALKKSAGSRNQNAL